MAKKTPCSAPYGRLQPATYHLCHRSVWYDPLHASLLIVCAVVPRPQKGSDAIRSVGNDGISKGRQTNGTVLFSFCDLVHLFLQNKF